MPSKLNLIDKATLAIPEGVFSGLKHLGPESFHVLGLETAAWPVKNAFNLAIAGNIHDLPHLIFGKSNKGGRKIQRMILADSIVAAKAATEGKVFANRKPLGLWLGTTQMPKAIAMHEANIVAQNTPSALLNFGKDNVLKTNRIKAALSVAGHVDDAAFMAQLAAPIGLGANNYIKARQHGDSHADAGKAALRGMALGGAISAGLILPRKIIKGAASFHNVLKQDGEYGYKLLDDAAYDASKVINSPHSYYKALYAKPEDNLKAFPGKFTGDTFKRALGQTTAKGYDRKAGYFYKDQGADLPLDIRFKNKAAQVVNKVMKTSPQDIVTHVKSYAANKVKNHMIDHYKNKVKRFFHVGGAE